MAVLVRLRRFDESRVGTSNVSEPTIMSKKMHTKQLRANRTSRKAKLNQIPEVQFIPESPGKNISIHPQIIPSALFLWFLADFF